MLERAPLSEKLQGILEAEYNALINGKIDQIEAFGEEKLQVLEAIQERSGFELHKMSHLRSKLIRNQILAQKAIEGMRLAITRAKEIERVNQRFATYNANGRQTSVDVTSGGVLSKRS